MHSFPSVVDRQFARTSLTLTEVTPRRCTFHRFFGFAVDALGVHACRHEFTFFEHILQVSNYLNRLQFTMKLSTSTILILLLAASETVMAVPRRRCMNILSFGISRVVDKLLYYQFAP